MSTKEVVILQHVANEGAGTMLDYLKKNGVAYRLIGLYRGDALPEDLSFVSAVLVMGGPMNVDEEEKFPFLRKEKLWIGRLIERGIPCLGVCLGAQLIARALGKRVYKAPKPEIGWQEVTLTAEAMKDPLFSTVNASTLRVLQWHEDTFDLPEGAVLLASGSEVPHQAYRYGDRAYGLQFHVEVNRSMLEDWFKDKENLAEILSVYDRYRNQLDQISFSVYERFFQRLSPGAEEEVEIDGGGWCV